MINLFHIKLSTNNLKDNNGYSIIMVISKFNLIDHETFTLKHLIKLTNQTPDKMFLPFRMTTKLIAKDSNSIDWSTTMKVLFKFCCCRRVVNLQIIEKRYNWKIFIVFGLWPCLISFYQVFGRNFLIILKSVLAEKKKVKWLNCYAY